MSHRRVICLCGRVIMQCRCPGPHQDTVKAGPCSCVLPEGGKRPAFTTAVVLPDQAKEAKAVEEALTNGCGDYYCSACSCADILCNEILRLREDIVEGDVLLGRLKERNLGAEARIKYLEDLIREAALKSGVGS